MDDITLRRLDPLDARPVYRQISAVIRDAIAAGTYNVGGRIHSTRRFSEHFGVASQTVRQALDELTRDGLIQPRHGTGFYVLTNRIPGDDPDSVRDIETELRRALLLLAHIPDTPLKRISEATDEIADIVRGIQGAVISQREQGQ